MKKLMVYVDKFLYDHFWKLPVHMDLKFKYEFPTKRLVKYCFEKSQLDTVKYKHESVAHMYAYDSTVDKDDLSLIHSIYHTGTRERVRQLLAKFIRKHYR